MVYNSRSRRPLEQYGNTTGASLFLVDKPGLKRRQRCQIAGNPQSLLKLIELIQQNCTILKQFCELNQEYQIDTERCLWQRIELWYGKNLQDDESPFEEILKRAIRNQAPKSDIDKDMEKAQRLDDNGLDVSSQHI